MIAMMPKPPEGGEDKPEVLEEEDPEKEGKRTTRDLTWEEGGS